MTYFLFLTAFTVSVDSLVCGFSLSLLGKKKITIISVITLTVYLMCLCANYLAAFIKEGLSEKTASLGGIILVAVGAFNLLKKDSREQKRDDDLFRQSLITGFAVGLDGAAANLSLSLMGINAFYVPVIIALMHGLMIATGIALAQTPLVKKFENFSFIPPVFLIFLGLYKLSALLF